MQCSVRRGIRASAADIRRHVIKWVVVVLELMEIFWVPAAPPQMVMLFSMRLGLRYS